MGYVREARVKGARLSVALREINRSARIQRRWQKSQEDGRPGAIRPELDKRLTAEEEQQILSVCHHPDYASLPPSQIVPRLADEGIYLASESSFYRVLRRHGEVHRRGRQQTSHQVRPAAIWKSNGPNQVYTWDITYLPSVVKGRWYYLYLVEDIYSRKIVGQEVHEEESGEWAAALMDRTVPGERCYRQPLVLHADNGAAMKSQTLKVKLEELKITPSHSRPRVSNDNAHVASLFRTVKYVPQRPAVGFSTLEEAREWVRVFTGWYQYNENQYHSGIRYVTPAQRHRGDDKMILMRRDEVYRAAQVAHPERWSGKTRNWQPISTVTLNPEREKQAA